MSSSPDTGPVTLPASVTASLAQHPGAVAALSTRDAELADLFAAAGLEPSLEAARPALRLLAATRSGRTRFGVAP